MTDGELILYQTEDGRAQIQLRAVDGNVWLTQAEIAALFDTTKQNVSLHTRNIIDEGELAGDPVVKESLTTAADGKAYRTKMFNLDMILAVGYRVRSPRGTQFRRWATTALKDYLVKGFVMNDERLKDPGAFDYFDELLERIRDIRASEKRFYQKVRDLFAQTSADHDGTSGTAKLFFQTIQNKMLYAVTGHTAAELIVARANPDAPNMGLTSWTGSVVRKADIVTAKNYLLQDEITELNRLVTMFLDFAEDRATRRQQITMNEWIEQTDRFLDFNERAVLENAGKISHEDMTRIAHDRYAAFDGSRQEAEAVAAEAEYEEDLRAIEAEAAKKISKKDKKK